jgi:flagellar basal-body rod protein FlgC
VSAGGEFDILRAAGAGMDAERAALDLAARNVAAAEATTPDGRGFERLVPTFARGQGGAVGEGEGFDPEPDLGSDDPDDGDGGALPIRYLGARTEAGVDVDAITEMVAVLDAQRGYEADASIFDLGKRLAERTIDVGRS